MIWIGTSWKMNKTRAQARSYASALADANSSNRWPHIQVFVMPSFTSLADVAESFQDSTVLVGAQNAHWEDSGAWTGEVSVAQLAEVGAQMVEIGHSERRLHFNETDGVLRMKVSATLRHGLIPVLCVGEPASVFEAGRSAEYVVDQAASALNGLSAAERGRVIVAYEPIWAIGEHGRAAVPTDIAGSLDALRREVGRDISAILYGGSVSRTNAVSILEHSGVDGLFVGRAALELEGFLSILDVVEEWAS